MMDNKNDVKWYNDKRFKYGTYSTVISIAVIAVLIALNLVVGLFDISADMTKENIFSIGESTKKVLADVNSDVKIYTTFRTNTDDSVITRVNEVLSQYKQECKYISTENTDLYLHPDFARQFASETNTVDVNSIIVQSGDRYRVINYEDYYNGNGKFSIESVLTSAIQFVSMEESPAIYQIVGHNEFEISEFDTVAEQLKLSNYDVKTVNLLKEDIPGDCMALLITPGQRDYSAEEADKVKAYLANDGRAFCLMGGDVAEYKNMKSIINAYGVDVSDRYVCEGDESAYIQYPYFISPQLKDHSITSNLISAGYRLLAYPNLAVTKTELAKKGLQIESVLTTTDKAYIKTGDNKSPNKETGDIDGTFDLAVAITDSSYTDREHSTKLFVTGCGYYMLEAETDTMVNNANSTFVVGVFNWLNDSQPMVNIASKNLDSAAIIVDSATQSRIKTLSWCVIPCIIFAAGFVQWFRRKNK